MESLIALIITLVILAGLFCITFYLDSGLMFVFGALFVLVLIFQGILTAAYYSERHACTTWAHRNNYEYNYSMLGDGCQVKIQGQWIDPTNVIVTDERD